MLTNLASGQVTSAKQMQCKIARRFGFSSRLAAKLDFVPEDTWTLAVLAGRRHNDSDLTKLIGTVFPC
jgi:hypothetical protein